MEPDPKYQGSLRETLEEIEQAGGSAIAVAADLSEAEDRERLFADVVEKSGAPDILVNNAAVTFLRPLDEFPERRVRLMMEMHVIGAAASDPVGHSRHARAPTWLGAERDVGGRGSARRSAVLRIRSRGGLRHLRHGQGRAESVDEKPCGRTVRRRDRRQRRRAVQSRRHPGRRRPGPGQDRHRGHRADHPDRVRVVHRRSEDADRPHRAHAAVPA